MATRSLFSNKKAVLLLISPGLAVILFSIAAPVILSVYYSLTEWAGFGKLTMVGFQNYRSILLADRTFWLSLFNALVLMVITIFIQNPIAFILAAVLTKVKKLSRFFRTVYFVPAIISVVVITKLWVNIFNPTYGLLNKILKGLGLEALTTAWLSDPSTALFAVIFIMIWYGFGWALLFYYSGLVTVPKDLEEAGIIDGASPLQLYTRLIIPYILPVIQAVLIIDVVSCLKQMEIVYLSTAGAPGDRTQFIANYLYIKAFTYSQYGYGNAISVLFVIIAILLTILTRRLTWQSPDVD
jgi:raffinose/stachyose/melibiose transport system permease protein